MGLPLRRTLALRAWSAAPRFVPGALRHVRAPGTIGLTIDDGPDAGATPEVLAALARHDLRATFFACGTAAQAQPDLLRSIAAAGHELGVHGQEHRSMLRMTGDDIATDLGAALGAFTQAGVPRPQLFRPPYGRWNPVHAGILRSLGLRLVLWSRMPGDFRPDHTVPSVIASLSAQLRAGDVLVLHAGAGMTGRIGAIVDGLALLLAERGWAARSLREAA